MLTGYASISTSVEAIKLGAIHYLAKPATADEIVAAMRQDDGNAFAPISAQPLSIKRLEWEHLQKVLAGNQGNISATARGLGMQRFATQAQKASGQNLARAKAASKALLGLTLPKPERRAVGSDDDRKPAVLSDFGYVLANTRT